MTPAQQEEALARARERAVDYLNAVAATTGSEPYWPQLATEALAADSEVARLEALLKPK